jgi:hypothetical protein
MKCILIIFYPYFEKLQEKNCKIELSQMSWYNPIMRVETKI